MIPVTEEHIQLTARLYEVRDTMRGHHGKDWAGIIVALRPILYGYAREQKVSLLNAAILIAKKATMDGQPMAAAQVLGVACELLEPKLSALQDDLGTGGAGEDGGAAVVTHEEEGEG